MAAKDVAKETNLVIIIINWWIDLAKEARKKVLETPEGHAALIYSCGRPLYGCEFH